MSSGRLPAKSRALWRVLVVVGAASSLLLSACAPRAGLPQFDEAEQQLVDLLEAEAEELAKLARLAAREEQRPVEFQDLVNRAGALEEAVAREQRDMVILQLERSPEHTQCLRVVDARVVIGC